MYKKIHFFSIGSLMITPFETITIPISNGTEYKVKMYDALIKQNMMIYEIDQPIFPDKWSEEWTTYTMISSNFSDTGHCSLMDAILASGEFIREGDHVFLYKLSNVLSVPFDDYAHFDVTGKLICTTVQELVSLLFPDHDVGR